MSGSGKHGGNSILVVLALIICVYIHQTLKASRNPGFDFQPL